MTPSLPEIARALKGQVSGRQVLAPGPNHSHKDRSLSVRLSDSSPDGFVVHSHAGDDWRLCRDHVADALGLARDRWRDAREPDPAELARRQEVRRRAEERERVEAERRQRFARGMWNEARDPRGSLVERYLNRRGLDLPGDIAGDVIRFHPACAFGDERLPCMVAAIRCIHTSAIVGVHRTALDPSGAKIGRKVFGSAAAGAVMLDPEDAITTGLTVGEGVETCMAARQLGIRPTWAMGSTSSIASFPVLPGIECLTVLAENDSGASAKACRDVGTRWHQARRRVDIVSPRIGKDMNDVLMGGATTWR